MQTQNQDHDAYTALCQQESAAMDTLARLAIEYGDLVLATRKAKLAFEAAKTIELQARERAEGHGGTLVEAGMLIHGQSIYFRGGCGSVLVKPVGRRTCVVMYEGIA